MKILFLILGMLLIASPVYAGFYYIVDMENIVKVKCDYEPDKADLESRQEIAVWCKEDIPLEIAEYRGGKIVVHTPTTKELEAEALNEEIKNQESMIRDKIREMAIEKIKENDPDFELKKKED